MHVIGFLTLIAVQAAVLGSSLHDDTITEFAVKMYHDLRAAKEDDNIFFSPLSIALAVGMVELGARGSSLKEIRHALGYDKLKNGKYYPYTVLFPLILNVHSGIVGSVQLV